MDEIRRIRRDLKLTQTQLAARAGIDRATLCLIEKGRQSPHVDTLQKIADGLGCEVRDFFPPAQPDLFHASVEGRAIPA